LPAQELLAARARGRRGLTSGRAGIEDAALCLALPLLLENVMRTTHTVLSLLAATFWLAGCGDAEDGASPEGTAGQAGSQADAAADVEPDSSDDAATEASPEAAADAPLGDCSQPARSFWIYDLSVMPPKYVEIPATCQGEGANIYLYVADDIWGTSMNTADVEQVVTAFDKATPAEPSKGIYAVTTGLFGQPTDVDGDGHVFLLYHKIKPYQGTQFDGFIRREDMENGTKSNNAEVLYLDGVRNDPGGEYMLGVAAHEFTHLILFNQNKNHAGWLSETMAETAMIANGYLGDLGDWVPSFTKNPTQSLTAEPPKFHYGAGFLFGGYLYERFGAAFYTALAKSPQTSIAGINATLTALGKTDTFQSLLPDWAAANFLDLPALQQGQYGYKAFDVPVVTSTAATIPAAEATYAVEPYSARYILFTVDGAGGSTLDLSMQSDTPTGLAFRYAMYPNTDKAAAQVGSLTMSAASETLSVAGVGGAVNRVMLAVVETGGKAATVKVAAALQ
jgi:hypothetical protein